MKRHFYLSNDLDDLEVLERDLESQNIDWPQIHILSNNEAGVENHHLHGVESLLRQDVVHSTKIGFVVGVVVALIPLAAAYIIGLEQGYLWIPVIFLSIILLGFCTWEGGFIGIQRPHHDYRKFEKALASGKHVLIIDVHANQEETLKSVLAKHPRIHAAGDGDAAPGWLIGLQRRWYRFIRWAP
ncbi:NAD/FAD-utilizing enzyme [Marinimicrobium sp. ABcell2]|uniref:NAD/FAD-utilizing enzyme n=1 Tax=Marinimicrobium sp. ABcell2 TaxID=3069751 RepID=UPI0027B4E5EB|nr:NAD/FAD-utilizing enzyme [Marinimicrobium sp. ABcell2]MDQ2078488.1 NAD/FAD-utilizing enzyme [Marinimicrobium sp. ABcell2]